MLKIILILITLESNGQTYAVGDSGRALGPLQIHKIFVDDVNRILGKRTFTYKDRTDLHKAAQMASIYLRYYGARYTRKTGLEATPVVLARIFNGGPNGPFKASTWKYAKRFKVLYDDRKYNRESSQGRTSRLTRVPDAGAGS